MANRVTPEDIQKINEIYYKTHTYAETARQVGFSAGTVKKYVIPGWAPTEIKDVRHFHISDIPEFNPALSDVFVKTENLGDLCVLTGEEQQEMHQLWKELSI